MEDVTASVFGILFVASFAVDRLTPPSRKTNAASLLLLLVAGLTLWTKIHLPISRGAAGALFLASSVCWIVFLIFIVPKWVREIGASARE